MIVNLFTAYFDESGTHTESEFVVVAGFISNEPGWDAFSVDWQVVLEACRLEYFHMSEFEHHLGPYGSWGDEEGMERLNRFLDIIHKHTFQSVGCVIPKESFDSILSPLAKKMCGGAYGLAALSCYRKLCDVANDPKVDGAMRYVMESGSRGYSSLSEIWREGVKDPGWRKNNPIVAIESRNKKEVLPLQAADILAYELYKHAPRQLGQETRRTRYPLKRLGRTLWQWNYVDDEELGLVEAWLSRFLPDERT